MNWLDELSEYGPAKIINHDIFVQQYQKWNSNFMLILKAYNQQHFLQIKFNMQINQRYDICRKQPMDSNFDSKIYSNYKNHLQHQFHDTSLSFDSIQTPGWTSLVATEQSKTSNMTKNHHPNPTHDPHNQILTRLNSLPKLKHQEGQFSNIRALPPSTKNKNIFVYGSIKEEEKKRMETPKSKQPKPFSNNSNRFLNQSNKKSHSSNQAPEINQPNRFSYSSKPNIFFSLSKTSQKNCQQNSRPRISSARSQSSLKLKDQIKERLSVGNYKAKNITSDFESNIKTEPYQKVESPSKPKSPSKFYSQIHSFNPIRQEKYMNRYLQKLNQRTKSNNTVKIFKKPTLNHQKEMKPSIKRNHNASNKQSILPLSLKRFNTITIHDHLYQKGMQMQTKKQVERMIDESYQKAKTLTFTPFISEKSHFLAESKFSRQSNADYSSGHHGETCFKKNHKNQNESQSLRNNIFTIQQQVTNRQKDKIVERQQNESLMKLFRLLSNKTSQINEKNVQVNIEKLPLSLLQILEPLLTQIYKKNVFDERKFIEVFSLESQNSIKEIAYKKHIVVTQTQRLIILLQRSSRKVEQKEDKENFMGNFNLNHEIEQKNYNE